MIPLDIRLFGVIEIQRAGETLTDFRSQKELVLLAYLICQARPLTRDFLAGLVWPEYDQSRALGLLRRSLHDLNQQLPGCLAIDRRTVCFCPDVPVTIDLHTFARCAQQCDPAAWAQAAALYRAPFLHGVYVDDAPELEAWLLREQEHWQREMVQVLHRLIRHHTGRAEYDQALHYTQRLLMLEPWREEAHRQAMLLLARTGQLSAALAQYERCRQTLQTELGVEPAHETERLYTRLKVVAHAPSPNLPVSITPFLGRENELAELVQLLADPTCRLITLVGPGGMGKTRLAIETARTVIAEQMRLFLHGAVFVSLVSVNTATQLVATLTQALALPLQSHQLPEVQLLQYLHDKELLLILDNFEQLVEPESLSLLSKLLHSAPDVKLLVTSRSRLQLQSEQLYWMQGLSLPATEQLTMDEIAGCSSVQLYLATTGRIRPDYTLTAQDVPAMTAICQRVQGMPLAIELAAAWMISLTPAEIAAELGRDLDFLASELHDLPLRQRSMRAVFATSWRLLTEAEQTVFGQLALFRGSFTRVAAQAVTGASLATLTNLIHKSFLQRASGERYQIHELLRQFGEEQLLQSPAELTAVQARHSRYYLTFLTQRTPGLLSAQQPLLLNEIGQEIDNIRHGWLWAARQGDCKLIQGALDGLYDYYQTRSQQAAGIELFAQAIQSLQQRVDPVAHQRLLARLQARQAALACEINQYAEAYRLLQASLAVARRHQDQKETAFCLEFIGRSVWWLEGEKAALPWLEESLAISRAIGDQIAVASTLYTLASVFDTAIEKLRARDFAEQSLALSRQLDHPYRTAAVLHRLGSIANGLDEFDAAVAYFQQSLTIFRTLDDRFNLTLVLAELGRSMYRTGKFSPESVMALLHEAVTYARALGTFHGLFVGVGIFGQISNWLGDYESGERSGLELVALAREMPPSFLASCLILLGESEVGLGKLTLARQHLIEAMLEMVKSQTRFFVNARLVLRAWLNLLCQESAQFQLAKQAAAAEQKQLEAIAVAACMIHQPQIPPSYKTYVAQVATGLKQQVPVALAAGAEACGQQKTLTELIAEIIQQAEVAAGAIDVRSLQHHSAQ
jgi:predicted ATPase/DNA-binding SARP family transcriptional activator